MTAPRRRTDADAPARAGGRGVAGLPWWGGVLVAVLATATGFAVDAARGSELTAVFAACYVLGCLAAALLVRRSALVGAVAQPALLLFVAVPAAYFLFTGGASGGGMKEMAINCGYPLIERFPLMLGTALATAVIGGVRWWLGRSAAAGAETDDGALGVADLVARVSALLARRGGTAGQAADPTPRRRAERASASRRPVRAGAAGIDPDEALDDRPRRGRPREEPARSRRRPDDERGTGRVPRERPGDERRPRRTRPADDVRDGGQRGDRPRRDASRWDADRDGRRRQDAWRDDARRDEAWRDEAWREEDRRQAERREAPVWERDLPPLRRREATHHPVSRVRYRGFDVDDHAERGGRHGVFDDDHAAPEWDRTERSRDGRRRDEREYGGRAWEPDRNPVWEPDEQPRRRSRHASDDR